MRQTPNALGRPEFAQRQAKMRRRKKEACAPYVLTCELMPRFRPIRFHGSYISNNHALLGVNDYDECRCRVWSVECGVCNVGKAESGKWIVENRKRKEVSENWEEGE